MKTRRQKKYKSVFEIDVDIVKHKREANRLEQKCAEMAKLFKDYSIKYNDDTLTPGEHQYWGEQMDWENKNIRKMRKKITSIFEMQIPRLIRTRAAMQTIPFPFMDGDTGVVIQHES